MTAKQYRRTGAALQDSFSPTGAARFIGVGRSTFFRWLKEGLVPAPALRIGKTTRFRRSDLEALFTTEGKRNAS